MNKNVIVTGASGFIGGATCIELKRKGYTVIGIDKKPLPKHLKSFVDRFQQCPFTHPFSLRQIDYYEPKAIIHCAGTSLVGPSIKNPEEYYDNNVAETIQYLAYIRRQPFKTKFIFSSSAAVYGDPQSSIALTEESKTAPISPYGESKLMVEKVLESFHTAYNLQYVALRYFNACGAVKDGLHGQEPGASHIFARIFEAIKHELPFRVFGNDYSTSDGTCVRDYVHVTDIANAHVISIEKDIQGIYNIGSDKGYSNLEILNAVRYWHKHIASIPLEYADKRPGDPAYLLADPTKFKNDTGWIVENSLQNIIKDLYDWYNSSNYAERSPAIIPL